MTVNTFYISNEGNNKATFPNLSAGNKMTLVIKKHDVKRGRGFTKFKFLSLNQVSDQICAYDMLGNCYIIDLDKNIYWCLKNDEDVCVTEFLQCHNKISLGCLNGLIKIFGLESGKLFGTFKGHTKPVKKISFNKIGDQCVSISYDKGFVWDPLTFKKLFLIEPNESFIIQETMFIPWYYKVIVQTSDNLLSVWHSKKGHLIKTFHALEILGICINSFSFKKNGSAMVACGDCNKLFYIDSSTWSLQKVFILPDSYTKLKCIEFISHPYNIGESNMVAFLSNHYEIALFDFIRGITLTVGPTYHDYCANLCINITGKYFVCLMGKGSIYIIHNELWNDQDMISSKLDILEETCHKGLTSHSKYFQGRNEDILNIISNFGQFPSDLRPFLWRKILSLPINTTAYRDLRRRGLHKGFSNILEYSFLPIDLRLPVLRLVSDLVFWCPIFQHVNCLPLMILRFSKLFKSSPLVAFEVVATILVNYCQTWFNEFPIVSQDTIDYVEYVLKTFDLDLWNHFNEFGIQNIDYVRPVMETLFVEVLVENDWLVLWDNVLTSRTDFLTLAVPAFYIANRNLFLSCKSKKKFEFYIHNPGNTDISIFTKKTKEIIASLKPKSNICNFAPLKKGNSYQTLTDSMNLDQVLTLAKISNSENVSVIRKVMEIYDRSEGKQPDSTNSFDKINGLGSINDHDLSCLFPSSMEGDTLMKPR